MTTSTSLQLASSGARAKRSSARGGGASSSSSSLASSSSNKKGVMRARRGVPVHARVGTSFGNKSSSKRKDANDGDDDATLTSRRALLAGKALFTLGGKEPATFHVYHNKHTQQPHLEGW
jgi:hypothetical protein